MNPQRDELQELWRAESAGYGSETGAAPASEAAGRAEAERLRRRVCRDGWLKIAALVFLGAAFPLLAGRMNPAAWGVLGFSLLAVVLGLVQVAWSAGWRHPAPPLPLAQGLAADLETWRRRRLPLALLLGATPALAWQVYQLAYLALNQAGSGRLVNLLFLTAGGPLLWLLASWRQWARLEAWLLQIERALGAFDGEAAARLELAGRRAGRRTAVIAVLLLLLLASGAVLFWLAR